MGLTTLAVGLLVTNLLTNVPSTTDPSAWFDGAMATALAIPVVLASWGFYTSSRG
jgi:hypothetical protein